MTVPTSESASSQYTVLHRTVENGQATEATWTNLARVCIDLGNKEEALQAYEHVTAPVLRRDLHHRLQRCGWVTQPLEDGVKNVTVTEADLSPSTREKLMDAVELLLDGKMRWSVLTATVAFPVVMGVGGMLAGSTDFILWRLAAMLPVLFVVGMVGAFGRHVLIQAMNAIDDASTLPGPRDLLREVPQALRDLGLLSAIFLVPGCVVLLLGQPMVAWPLFLPAAFFMPMATALRLACGGHWGALKPKLLLAATRGCKSYFGTAGVVALLFAPALAVLFFAVDKPLFLVVSVIGPLSVTPFFIAMRMLGLTLHYERTGVPPEFALPIKASARAHTVKKATTTAAQPSANKPAPPPAKEAAGQRQATMAAAADRKSK